MNTFLLMLIVCTAVQRVYSKSLFDYNINPEYELLAQESSASYTNFRPNSQYYVAPRRRYRHHGTGREHGNPHDKRKHALAIRGGKPADDNLYPDASDQYDYFDQSYYSPHFHHPHGFPPGQEKQHGQSYGSHYGHSYVIPPRFPPPPVYDKNFLNPWTLSGTASRPFIGQQPPLTTPRPLFEQHQPFTTPAVYVAPKFTTTTTPSPLSSTTAEDQMLYDIDVRFGGV